MQALNGCGREGYTGPRSLEAPVVVALHARYGRLEADRGGLDVRRAAPEADRIYRALEQQVGSDEDDAVGQQPLREVVEGLAPVEERTRPRGDSVLAYVSPIYCELTPLVYRVYPIGVADVVNVLAWRLPPAR